MDAELLCNTAMGRLFLKQTALSFKDMTTCLQYGRDVASVQTFLALRNGLDAIDSALFIALVILTFSESEFPEAASLGTVLENLDRQFPSLHRTIKGEVTMLFADIVQSIPGNWSGPPPRRLHSWKHAFSIPLTVAALYDIAAREVEAARTWESSEWTSVVSKHSAFDRALEKDLWRVSRAKWYPVEEIELRWRESRARLRLVQAAARYRHGGSTEVTDLPTDPFTLKPLHFRKESGRILFWSEWKDGDDNGTGDWLPKGSRQDLVVELRD